MCVCVSHWECEFLMCLLSDILYEYCLLQIVQVKTLPPSGACTVSVDVAVAGNFAINGRLNPLTKIEMSLEDFSLKSCTRLFGRISSRKQTSFCLTTLSI